MEHEKIMSHAVMLAAAYIQNGDLRHDGNFRDEPNVSNLEKTALLVCQMYRAVEEASFLARQPSWAARMRRGEPEPGGSA